MKMLMFFIMGVVLSSNPIPRLSVPQPSYSHISIQDKNPLSQEKTFSGELDRRLLETRLLNQSV